MFLKGYIFSRPFMGERVPQHIQNIVLRDYCNKIGGIYLLSATEYSMQDSKLILEQVLNEVSSKVGIVAYSLFQLPSLKKDRMKVYCKIINLDSEMHFSVEGLSIKKMKDVARIENMWLVRNSLDKCNGIPYLKKYLKLNS